MAEDPSNLTSKVNDEGRRPPGWRPHDRGWREGDPGADSVMPAREAGAGGSTDDGPNEAGGEETGAPRDGG
ncbi:MAG: hypothetical protein V7678_03750 [Brevundimonas sp.]